MVSVYIKYLFMSAIILKHFVNHTLLCDLPSVLWWLQTSDRACGGWMHLPPWGVTRWQCSLLPDYFGHLLCVFMCYAGASKEDARSTTDQSREGNLVSSMFSFYF